MKAFALASAALLAAGLFSLAGCARTAEERQLDAMRSDIERIQNERDEANRPIAASESSIAAQEPAGLGDPTRAASASSAPLRVGGGAGWDDAPPQDDYADPEDTAPRPRIRMVGGRTRSERGAPSEAPSAVVEDAADPASGLDGSHATGFDPQAKVAYDAALSLVNAKQYDKGLDALAAFLVRWPDHPYADHAIYWRGECYYAKGETSHALEQFEGLLARFPAAVKAPDALLKAGLCHQRLGHPAEARQSFDRLVREFPQSEAARRAPPVSVPAATPSGPASEDRP